MEPCIVGIVGDNAYGALTGATYSFCLAFKALGFRAELIDFNRPEGVSLFSSLIDKNEISFGFGIQGIGSCLQAKDGSNLWAHLRKPFVSIHHDHPCHNPYNHFSNTPFIANIYRFQSFSEVRSHYLPETRQINHYWPFKFSNEIPRASTIPFAERPIKFLFLKSGFALDDLYEEAERLPKEVRQGLWDQVKRCEKSPNLEICDLVKEVFTTLGFDHNAFQKQFWSCVKWMDKFIRRKRALDFANWLKFQEGAVIVGEGWDCVDQTGAKALFQPAIGGAARIALFDQTQFICNTNPYARDILHERIMLGLGQECCVLTDTNAWWDENFSDVPALIRFNWDKPISEQLGDLPCHPAQAAEAARQGRTAMLERLQSDGVETVLEVVERIKSVVA